SRHSVLLNYPFLKILANRAFHAIAVVLFGRRFRDLTNNLKIMRREVVADLRLRQPGFAVNAETALQPLLLAYSVKQVPISWINRQHRRDWLCRPVLLLVCIVIWIPRFTGPINFRWDASAYYILGTALSQGHGYRLLNEPGEIEAVQYPPLLPMIVAAVQSV